MNTAPSTHYSVLDSINAPHVPPTFNYNLPEDVKWLRKELWTFQGGTCALCGCETRIGGTSGTDYATLTNINTHPKNLINTAGNMLMSCMECDKDKSDKPVELHLLAKIRRISPERRENLVATHKLLKAYFDQFRNNQNKGRPNEYMALDVEKMVLTETRREAPNLITSKEPEAVKPASEAPQQEEETTIILTPQEGETEAQECLRWTINLQKEFTQQPITLVHQILNCIHRFADMHNKEGLETNLGRIIDSMTSAMVAEHLFGRVPEAKAALPEWLEPDEDLKNTYLKEREGLTLENEQLRIQQYLAMFTRNQRRQVVRLVDSLLLDWDSTHLQFLTLNSFFWQAELILRLDHAYANNPKLKKLFH